MKGIELLTISVLILLIIYLAIRPGNGVSNTRNTQ